MIRAVILIAACMAGLAGCNTVAGVGNDVTSGAQTVQGWFRGGGTRY